jgi:hypothetical protein
MKYEYFENPCVMQPATGLLALFAAIELIRDTLAVRELISKKIKKKIKSSSCPAVTYEQSTRPIMYHIRLPTD